jgi:hypothetical protein
MNTMKGFEKILMIWRVDTNCDYDMNDEIN